jgi:hypothetical protein
MKIQVTTAVEVPFPLIVIEARQAVFAKLNTELLGLKLPFSELSIPRNGFDEYHIDAENDVVGCVFNPERPGHYTSKVKIPWGHGQNVRLLRALEGMDALASFLR